MSLLVFSKSGLSDLTIEHGRILPASLPKIQINQERMLTENNKSYVISYGNNFEMIEAMFENLTKDNFDGATNGLKTWFQDSSINWSENSFTLTDEFGATYTVRYWDDNFEMPLLSNGRYSIKLTLKVEA